MKKIVRRSLILLLLACSAAAKADTTILISISDQTPGMPSVSRNVYYRRGSLRRKDSLGHEQKPSFSSIADCNNKSGFLIDLDAHEYRTYKTPAFWSETQLQEYLQKNPRYAVHIESRTIDTGERKMFFGLPARHLITTMTRAPTKDNGGGEDMIDGWYVDHEGGDSGCAPDFVRSTPFYVLATVLVVYPEVPQFHHDGPMPIGLAVELTRTVRFPDANGKTARIITIKITVEELTDSPLSPSLFDLPAGLHENPQLLKRGAISQE